MDIPASTEFGDGDLTIVNLLSGTIDGGRYGIHAAGLGSHEILNAGTIRGGEYSILGDSGVELVTNIGT
ncbi:MAG: hypothetical protein R3D30_13635 [Hyphomicrobiales bacterium]